MRFHTVPAATAMACIWLLASACKKEPGAIERARAKVAAMPSASSPPVDAAAGDAKRPETDAEAAAGRMRRQAVVSPVAPGAVVEGGALALLGDDGTSSDGYPKAYVDRAALRRLLRDQKYAELDRQFEALQAKFEDDPRYEYWPMDAGDAFGSAESELKPQLDLWVAATSSFGAHLARAVHLVNVGYARRGTKWASETNAQNFQEMRTAMEAASRDLDEALRLRPKLVAAQRYRMKLNPGPRAAVPFREAVATCPACFQIYATYLLNSTPRWGGTYPAMTAAAAAAPVALNARLSLLPGYVDADQASLLSIAKKYDEALAAVERACALGDNADFLVQRASIQRRREQYDRASQDLERAWSMRPGSMAVRGEQAIIAMLRKEYELAGRALFDVLQADPTDPNTREWFPNIVQGVVYQGVEFEKMGRKNEALRLLDLAVQLDPTNQAAIHRRSSIVANNTNATSDDEITRLKAQADAAPDDFRAHQALDYALAKQRRFEEVVSMWNAYLARNPRDGQAHLERGGAFHHLQRPEDAKRDAQAACDLGVSEGCVRAR